MAQPALQRLARQFSSGIDADDAELLGRFHRRRDEGALEALLRRHGPMVLGVCRRVLGNDHDADDAFQAVFLVLIRRAGSVQSPHLLAGWLHGVAVRVAGKARRRGARRRERELQVLPMPERAARPEPGPSDLRLVLDAELARLPERYRAAVALCDLEGHTRKEAARRLACPEGTLS